MPRRALNAVVGFCVGSAAYFLFLFALAVLGARGWLPWQDFTTRCWARTSSGWFRLVSEAQLNHRLQPHYLYLSALMGSLLFIRINRPFREDLPIYSHRFAAISWVFAAAVALNLWFSVANILPGRFGL